MTTTSELLLGPAPARDYTVAGPAAAQARAAGLVDGEWFVPPIDPNRLHELSAREFGHPLLDLGVYVVALVSMGALAAWLFVNQGVWWSLLAFVPYWGLYGGTSDARWHEFGHGTATPSERVNEAVYAVASFQTLRTPGHWQWSHFRHHSDTIVVGRDPEIQLGRPGTVRRWLINFTGLLQIPTYLRAIAGFSFGRFDDSARDYVPETERPSLVRQARWWAVLVLVPFVLAVAAGSWLPVLLVGVIPSTLGVWGMVFFGVTQHLGLAEDVLDHRANTRTVLMNPVFRFLYLNMNYHVEHHIFPTVPYYRLPALHAEIADALPPPTPNMLSAYAEIFGSLRRQRRDPLDVVPDRPVPDVESMAGSVAALGWARPNGTDDLGPLERFAVGSVVRVDVADRTYAVARVSETELCALDGVCTHGNAHLGAGDLVDEGDGPQVRCPKHLGRFDARTGAVCSKPLKEPIVSHAAEIVSGHLHVTRRARPSNHSPKTPEVSR
ncbi:MAG: fatty acid desaturase [Ilumatobacter sp.]